MAEFVAKWKGSTRSEPPRRSTSSTCATCSGAPTPERGPRPARTTAPPCSWHGCLPLRVNQLGEPLSEREWASSTVAVLVSSGLIDRQVHVHRNRSAVRGRSVPEDIPFGVAVDKCPGRAVWQWWCPLPTEVRGITEKAQRDVGPFPLGTFRSELIHSLVFSDDVRLGNGIAAREPWKGSGAKRRKVARALHGTL